MKTLILRKMGCNFMYDSDWNTSDCGNYRLRAEFTDKDGKKVCADFFPDGTYVPTSSLMGHWVRAGCA